MKKKKNDAGQKKKLLETECDPLLKRVKYKKWEHEPFTSKSAKLEPLFEQKGFDSIKIKGMREKKN